MTETEIPQLHLSRDHIMAMTQVLTMLSQRLAEQREAGRDGPDHFWSS